MAAYGSSAAATDTDGTVTVTKPSGLAAGDLMVAFCANPGQAGDINTPSGWTLMAAYNAEDDSNLNEVRVFAKIAEASDASASDFTFSHSSPAGEQSAVLYRITGTFASVNNIYAIVAQIGSDTADDVYRFSTGITPSVANSLLIMFVSSFGNGSNDSPVDTYTLQTDNPTWTERHDASYNSQDFNYATATATRTETTATGYYQVTFNTSGDVSRAAGVLLAIADTQNGTATPAVISIASSVPDPTPSGAGNVTATVVTMASSVPTASATAGEALWKNTDKPSPSSISNTDKP
jgi:hypothetical protein